MFLISPQYLRIVKLTHRLVNAYCHYTIALTSLISEQERQTDTLRRRRWWVRPWLTLCGQYETLMHDRAAPLQTLKCGPGRPLLLLPGSLWTVCVLEETSLAPVYSQTLLSALQQTLESLPVAQRSQLIYCVRKNNLQYSRHNCKLLQIYTRFGNFWHEPFQILQRTKNRKFCPALQHRFLEMTSKGKHDTASQLKKFAYKNQSLRWLNDFRKNDNSGYSALFGIGRRPTLSCRHLFSGVARSRYLNMR